MTLISFLHRNGNWILSMTLSTDNTGFFNFENCTITQSKIFWCPRYIRRWSNRSGVHRRVERIASSSYIYCWCQFIKNNKHRWKNLTLLYRKTTGWAVEGKKSFWKNPKPVPSEAIKKEAKNYEEKFAIFWSIIIQMRLVIVTI